MRKILLLVVGSVFLVQPAFAEYGGGGGIERPIGSGIVFPALNSAISANAGGLMNVPATNRALELDVTPAIGNNSAQGITDYEASFASSGNVVGFGLGVKGYTMQGGLSGQTAMGAIGFRPASTVGVGLMLDHPLTSSGTLDYGVGGTFEIFHNVSFAATFWGQSSNVWAGLGYAERGKFDFEFDLGVPSLSKTNSANYSVAANLYFSVFALGIQVGDGNPAGLMGTGTAESIVLAWRPTHRLSVLAGGGSNKLYTFGVNFAI
jgi:hypothetical protein